MTNESDMKLRNIVFSTHDSITFIEDVTMLIAEVRIGGLTFAEQDPIPNIVLRGDPEAVEQVKRGLTDRLEEKVASVVERLARRLVDETEKAGRDMYPDEKPEPWTFDSLTEEERTGLIATMYAMLDKGYIWIGPKLLT